MSIKDLEEWLSQHKNEIPQKPTWKRTLLDIMGCTKLENRWSDLYQFFLLEEEEHGLKDLFIRSLEEFIIGVEKGWMKNFCVLREYPTKESSTEKEGGGEKTDDENKSSKKENSHKKEKGRIDLLILGEDKKAIIIENKVFHTLDDNPLEQYVKTTKEKGWTDIKVIVLSLSNNYGDIDSIDGCKCLNLTHSNYINKVMENLPNYLLEANSFYLLILKNFIQNIINVTNMSATNDELLFFSKEFEYISKIQGLYSRIIREYKSSLNKIEFDGLKPYYKSINDDDNNQLVYFQYEKCPNLYLTVMLNYLWIWNKEGHKKPFVNKEGQNKPFVKIVLEIHPDGKNLEAIDNVIIKQIAEHPKDYTNVKYSNLEDKNKSWRHLAYVDYDIQFKNGEQFIRPEELARQIKNKLSESNIYKLGKEVIKLINPENDCAKI